MIYFVLPIYNEEENLEEVIRRLRAAMTGRNYRMIAVNDGSLDRSLEILKEHAADDLIVVQSLINMNVGAVFSTGIARALEDAKDEDRLVIMESDKTSEIDFVEKLLDALDEKKCDVVVASRYQAGGRYVNFPLPRLVFSYCANALMRQFFPITGVRDYTIFFRAYRVRVLRKMMTYFGPYGLIQSKGFVANAELLIKASIVAERVEEIPYVYDYKKKLGKSKINVLRTINEYFVLITYMRRIFDKVELWKRKNNVSLPAGRLP